MLALPTVPTAPVAVELGVAKTLALATPLLRRVAPVLELRPTTLRRRPSRRLFPPLDDLTRPSQLWVLPQGA